MRRRERTRRQEQNGAHDQVRTRHAPPPIGAAACLIASAKALTRSWSFAESTSGAFAFRAGGALVVRTAWEGAAGGQTGCTGTVRAGAGAAERGAVASFCCPAEHDFAARVAASDMRSAMPRKRSDRVRRLARAKALVASMHRGTRASLTALSIPTDLFDAIERLGHSLENLRSFSASQLRSYYTDAHADILEQKIKRKPIDHAVVSDILAASARSCAYCSDGDSAKPFQLHHIGHYAATQDNTADNLLLVCPTHHAWIHRTGESEERQRSTRRQWYSLVEVGREYASRGMTFPYGAFESLDYMTPPRVTEILAPFPATPSTAASLSQHSLAQACIEQITLTNFVLIVGGSGSGKSTLAVGISGAVGGPDRRVYRYRRGASIEARQVLREITTFLGVKVVKSTLIVDDANTWATPADMEQLAAAANSSTQVVATWTGGKLVDDPTVEVRLLAHRKLLNWEDVRPSLVASLLKHEVEVVRMLRETRPKDIRNVGHGTGDRTLESLLQQYASTSKSVWQFLFLLRGGWGAVREDLALLINDDRADGPVLYAAIEQIADVERPVRSSEAVLALTGDSSGGGPLEDSWIEQVYEGLVSRRMMLRVRNGFTTVHRQWACALIDAAIERDDARPTADLLLHRVFDVHASKPRRLMVLWSWLWYEKHGGKFVRDWAESLGLEDWTDLVRNAAASGIVDVGMVANRMHLLFSSPGWTSVVGAAMESNEEAIGALVASATADDWYWLGELFMTLNYARPECAARVLLHWPAERAAVAVRGLRPEMLNSAWWFLAGVRKHSRAWCDGVGVLIDEASKEEVAKRFQRGDVASVKRFSEILERLGVPVRRRDVTAYAGLMRNLLQGALLSEIELDFDLSDWLEFFPSEAEMVAASLDPVALAVELAVASPRYWGALLELSAFAQRAGVEFGRRVADAVPETIGENIRLYDEPGAHELRLLVWQLAYGSPATRAARAVQLQEPVRRACGRSEVERPQLVQAFWALDASRGELLAQEYGVPVPDRNMLEEIGRPLLDALPNAEVIRRKLAFLDASGENYDVWKALGLADVEEAS